MSTIKQFLDNLLGVYTPITFISDGNEVIPPGFAGVDWPYLVRALVFLLILWSIFRILGGIICRT